MGRRVKQNTASLLPAVSSDFWLPKCMPLLDFLKEEPRNWFELVIWAKANHVGGYLLRNYLAYLEEASEAEGVPCKNTSTGKYLWVWRPLHGGKPMFDAYVEVPVAELFRELKNESVAVEVDDRDLDEEDVAEI